MGNSSSTIYSSCGKYELGKTIFSQTLPVQTNLTEEELARYRKQPIVFHEESKHNNE